MDPRKPHQHRRCWQRSGVLAAAERREGVSPVCSRLRCVSWLSAQTQGDRQIAQSLRNISEIVVDASVPNAMVQRDTDRRARVRHTAKGQALMFAS